MKTLAWFLPLILIALLAPFTPQIDLAIEHYFYTDGHFQSNNFLYIIHTFGVVPGWILALGALTLFILSFIYPKLKAWRPFILLPLLTMLIGAGLIIDRSFKEHWGRPRPKQIIEFGGIQPFRPFYKPNFFEQPEPSKSFPSGHASMGFLFFSLFFVGLRLKKPWVFWTGFMLTLVLGSLLGYARMAQGGHFFSDVIMSAAIMWWSALFSDWLISKKMTYETTDQKAT